MGVRGSPSMSGNVLENRQYAALFQAVRHRASDGRNLVRLGSVSPVANHGVGAGNRHIRQRQAIDAHAELDKVRRHQPRAQACRGQAGHAIDVVKRPKDSPRRVDRPVRWAEALDPASLLVEQHRRVRVPDRSA
jgi:hypothetical protein